MRHYFLRLSHQHPLRNVTSDQLQKDIDVEYNQKQAVDDGDIDAIMSIIPGRLGQSHHNSHLNEEIHESNKNYSVPDQHLFDAGIDTSIVSV